jgi:hypothetical protein
MNTSSPKSAVLQTDAETKNCDFLENGCNDFD